MRKVLALLCAVAVTAATFLGVPQYWRYCAHVQAQRQADYDRARAGGLGSVKAYLQHEQIDALRHADTVYVPANHPLIIGR